MSGRTRNPSYQTTQTMLRHASQIAEERHAQGILVCGGNIPSRHLFAFESRLPTVFFLSGRNASNEHDGSRFVIRIPHMPPTRMSRVRLGILLAVSRSLLKPRDLVVSVTTNADGRSLDTVVVLRVGDEFDMLLGPRRRQWESSDLRPDVVERVVELATELAVEGREATPVGGLFVIGDLDNVLPKTQQMVLNPFQGYPAERRNILDRRLGETIKEFSTIDGAFLVHGDGTIESAGAYVHSSLLEGEHVPHGLGARHRAAAGITAVTRALAIALSQSTGTVTIFHKGRIVTEIPRPGGGRGRPAPPGRRERGKPIIVVGGGIAGVSIAWRLAEAGLPVTLVESGRLGSGATTRNQGWLHSGALVAPDDQELASMAYRSLRQTLEFCPECVEPQTSRMLYLFTSKATRVRAWTQAWSAAGIPWERVSKEGLERDLPGIDSGRIRSAFRLPDRSIRFDVLLNRIAAAARQAGVDIRTDTSVERLLEGGGEVRGVLTESGVRIPARLVILAAGAAMEKLLPHPTRRRPWPGDAARFVVIKSHLVALRPGVARAPFCIAEDGFNHLPHDEVSVLHSNHWIAGASLTDVQIVPEEVERIRQTVGALFPERDEADWNVTEWTGTTIETSTAPGKPLGWALRPLVIGDSSRRALTSVAPGRATLWPVLAEHVLAIVLAKRNGISTAAPPWIQRDPMRPAGGSAS